MTVGTVVKTDGIGGAKLVPQTITVKSLLSQDAYKKRFEEVLGRRAPQYMASIVNASLTLPSTTEPKSVIAAAFVAATLDLPIDRNLGFAHIIPYKNVAQFQMGYKGFVQLALRTGQYERMNVKPVNADAFGGYDEVGEPRILWDKIDELEPPIGYAFAWRLTSGFVKVIYWTREKVEAHAKRYSAAYKSGRKDSPWFTDFDRMAMKTIVKNGLSQWGILSVELRTALEFDQAAQRDVDDSAVYVDHVGPEGDGIAVVNAAGAMQHDDLPSQTDPADDMKARSAKHRDGFLGQIKAAKTTESLKKIGLTYSSVAESGEMTEDDAKTVSDAISACAAETMPTK